MIDSTVEHLALLLLIVCLVAIVSRKLHIPYTVGLVFAGMGLALSHYDAGIEFSKPMIYVLLLPPLVFEAALQLRWRDLKKDAPLLLALSVPGAVIAATIVMGLLIGVLRWDWRAAALFAALIVATDPVSVFAAMKAAPKSVSIPPRLPFLLESESLFNDGTAAALFAVTSAIVLSSAPNAASNTAPITAHMTGPINILLTPGLMSGIFASFIKIAGGGIGVGTLVGLICLLITGRTDDPFVEVAMSAVSAYGAFVLAEQIGTSGVLATLTTGLILGNVAPRGEISARGIEIGEALWEYAAFLSSSFIFLLMGLQFAASRLNATPTAIVFSILAVLVARAISVYGVCLPFLRTKWIVPWAHQHILVWGGLRGALALALALGLPASVPQRAVIVSVTFTTVAFSVIVQGFTFRPLLKRLLPIQAAPTPP